MFKFILAALALIGVGLVAVAALANAPERHFALEFANKRVSLLAEFKTDRACQAQVGRLRKDAEHQPRYPGGVHYGCESGSQLAVTLARIFGRKAAEVLQ